MIKDNDNSFKVYQRDKIKEKFLIKNGFNLTATQEKILESALDPDVTAIILNGLAGTSKTFCSILACLKLLNDKKISDIIYIRSTVQAKDGETGFLTGDLKDKMYYYNIPLFDKLGELLNKNDIQALVADNRIKTFPTSMLRGYNFNVNGIILDEAQNCHFDSIFTVLTRIGRFSKVFILGDTRGQNDYNSKSGFKAICEIFNDEESYNNGIRYFQLDMVDIVRSPFVKFVIEKVNKYNHIH
jgi:phosphate starvation-inducible protein PhoH